MTFVMESFGESTLGAFIESTLHARDDEIGDTPTPEPTIWGGGRDTTGSGAGFVREYNTDFSTSRHSDVVTEFGIGVWGCTGCGGSYEALFYAAAVSMSHTSRFYELTRNWNGTTVFATITRTASFESFGAGGDGETLWTSVWAVSAFERNAIQRRDPVTWSVIEGGLVPNFGGAGWIPLAPSECGGDASIMFSTSYDNTTGEDWWYTALPGNLSNALSARLAPGVYAYPTAPYTLGCGGSGARGYFFQSYPNVPTRKDMYEVDPSGLGVVTGPVNIYILDYTPYGVGGD